MVHNKPTFSVLMPAYNCEQYIEEAIESIINQTFEDWELIVLDDGSSDGTSNLLKKYNDKRIHIHTNTTNQGIVKARNRLLELSRGAFITWLDADDTSHLQRLEQLYKKFGSQPELMLCGSNFYRNKPVSGIKVVSNFPITNHEIKQEVFQKSRLPFLGATVAFRREVLGYVPSFRSFFNIGGADPDFILRVVEKFTVANLSNPLYFYRYTRDSISRSYQSKQFLRIYLRDIHFFLHKQRVKNNGLDGLMKQGNQEEFNCFLAQLKQQYELDPSIVQRRACKSKISNEDYLSAVKDAFLSIQCDPKQVKNYSLIPMIGKSLAGRLLVRVRNLFQSNNAQ